MANTLHHCHPLWLFSKAASFLGQLLFHLNTVPPQYAHFMAKRIKSSTKHLTRHSTARSPFSTSRAYFVFWQEAPHYCCCLNLNCHLRTSVLKKNKLQAITNFPVHMHYLMNYNQHGRLLPNLSIISFAKSFSTENFSITQHKLLNGLSLLAYIGNFILNST